MQKVILIKRELNKNKMCGIAGFNWDNKKLVNDMASILKHRGPDDSGCFTDKNISLGHSRLSIIDLSKAGHQPMIYDHRGRKAIIVYNGEIYNYKELRKELAGKGYLFNSRTDTEVVIACYLEYGFDCVDRFNGMWAFCIYDVKTKTLFCSRDRLGKKPFYYYYENEKFIFASELKAILKHDELCLNSLKNLNEEAIDLYFSLGFIPAPFSIYNNTFKLEAGHNLTFDLTRNRITKSWRFYDMQEYSPIYDREGLIDEGRNLLKDAINLRLRSDVTVGTFLSGGLDSSTITAIMKDFVDIRNLHTFSVGFEGGFDETPYVNTVKDFIGTNHHHYYFYEDDFQALIDSYSYAYDEPFYDYSGFPTYKISEIAKGNVSVLLSGDGGDEVFAGYWWHQLGFIFDLIKDPIYSPAEYRSHGMIYKPEVFQKWFKERLNYSLNKGDHKCGEAFRIYDLLFNTIPDDFMVKVDRASMANSVEVRCPFLDYRFIEFSQKIPTEWKVNNSETKILMREVIRGLLPEKIISRGKQGFEPPLVRWIQDEKYESYAKNFLVKLGEINEDLYDLYELKVFKDKEKYVKYIIRLFLFAKWFEKWVEKK